MKVKLVEALQQGEAAIAAYGQGQLPSDSLRLGRLSDEELTGLWWLAIGEGVRLEEAAATPAVVGSEFQPWAGRARNLGAIACATVHALDDRHPHESPRPSDRLFDEAIHRYGGEGDAQAKESRFYGLQVLPLTAFPTHPALKDGP